MSMRCCGGSPRRTWTPGSSGSPRTEPGPARPPGDGGLASALDRQRAARRARRRSDGARAGTGDALRADDSHRPCIWSPGPAGSSRDELVAASGGMPALYSPLRGLPRGRRSGRDPGGRRRPGGRAGRGLAAGRDRARDGPADRAGPRWLDLAAGPGGKAGLLGALAAGTRRRGGRRRDHPAPRRPGPADRPRPAGHACTPPTAAIPDCPRRRSTGSSWTRPAPGSVRSAGDRRPAGGGSRPTSRRWSTLQRELLDSAARLVRPGGLVAYVTCSPHLAETAGVIGRRPGGPGTDRRPRRCCPGCRTSATARRCSSGRTGTAPTGCSWRCCASGADPDLSPAARAALTRVNRSSPARPGRSARRRRGAARRSRRGRHRSRRCATRPFPP